MRSYIFTTRERQVIRSFLDSGVKRDDPLLMVVLSRIKGFKNLAMDIELYRRLTEAVAATSA
jgi:hypothetical protein